MHDTVTRPTVALGTPVYIRVLRTVGRVFQAWKHRRDVEHLLRADDRMLADMGLTRADVTGALAAPITHDPSLLLVRARQDARRRRTRGI